MLLSKCSLWPSWRHCLLGLPARGTSKGLRVTGEFSPGSRSSFTCEGPTMWLVQLPAAYRPVVRTQFLWLWRWLSLFFATFLFAGFLSQVKLCLGEAGVEGPAHNGTGGPPGWVGRCISPLQLDWGGLWPRDAEHQLGEWEWGSWIIISLIVLFNSFFKILVDDRRSKN